MSTLGSHCPSSLVKHLKAKSLSRYKIKPLIYKIIGKSQRQSLTQWCSWFPFPWTSCCWVRALHSDTRGCGTNHSIPDSQFPEVLIGDNKTYEIHLRWINISKCKSKGLLKNCCIYSTPSWEKLRNDTFHSLWLVPLQEFSTIAFMRSLPSPGQHMDRKI